MPNDHRGNHHDDAAGWTLTLRPLPGGAVPPVVRLRRLLKLALRAFGLRCVSVTQTPERPATLTLDRRDDHAAHACPKG